MSSVGGNARVLIVDCHRPSTIVLRISLQMHGYAPACAETSEAALDYVTRFRPEIVICEWKMPGGIGLPKRLRRAATASGLSIGVITLSTQDEPDGFRDLEQVDGYVRKPYDLSVLERMIERLRDRLSMPRSSIDAVI